MMGVGNKSVPIIQPETMRDRFAMAALTGLIMHGGDNWCSGMSDAVAMAYRYADAMMEARK